jgi:50S ribosomal protein L16 3-hydroxylase
MRRLADARRLTGPEVARAGADARDLLAAWCESGWAHGEDA